MLEIKKIKHVRRIRYNPDKKEMTDIGWWMDLETGEVSVTENHRPLKAAKYIKEDEISSSFITIPNSPKIITSLLFSLLSAFHFSLMFFQKLFNASKLSSTKLTFS